MAQPTVTSISFDQSVYEPGDTITATVIYSSPNTHGGDGNVGYDLAVTLTDEVTDATNTGLSGQSAEFYVDSGPVLPNQVLAAVTAALAAAPALEVSSLSSGGTTGSGSGSFDVFSGTVAAGTALILFGGPGLSDPAGLGDLEWTHVANSPSGYVGAWVAVVPSGGVSGTLSVTSGGWSSTIGEAYFDLVAATGVDPESPIVTANTQLAVGGVSPASVTFSSASNAGNRFLFCTAPEYCSGGPGESSAWTELANVVGEYVNSSLEAQVSPDASVLEASANVTVRQYMAWDAVGLELNVFQSGTGLPPADWTLIFNNLDSDGVGTAVFQAVA